MEQMKAQFLRFKTFLTDGIWQIRLHELPLRKHFLFKQIRIILLAIRGFDEDKCQLRASALTFYTLLSIVPVAAMAFGIAKGFGFEKRLEHELLNQIPGQEEVLLKVFSFAQSLLLNTKGGLIAGVGIAVLFWSVIKVLSHIEASMNDIWQIQSSRTWSRKFSDYLAIMMVSPIFVLLSGSVTVFITSQVTIITKKISLLGYVSPLIFGALKLLPYCLIWVLFTFIYLLMPNTRVRLTPGLFGGIVAGTAYQLAQWAYINFQIGVTRYNAIYGSFAALPLFLLWLQISWLIVLFGAEIAFATQNVDTYEYEPDAGKISEKLNKLLSLRVVHLLVKNFTKGSTPVTQEQISHTLGLPTRLVRRILHDLVQSGLVSATRTGDEKIAGYQPARDTGDLTIRFVLKKLEERGVNHLPNSESPELDAFKQSLSTFGNLIETSEENRLLREI